MGKTRTIQPINLIEEAEGIVTSNPRIVVPRPTALSLPQIAINPNKEIPACGILYPKLNKRIYNPKTINDSNFDLVIMYFRQNGFLSLI